MPPDGKILPETRSDPLFFFSSVSFFHQKSIRVKICARAWDPDYAYRENSKHQNFRVRELYFSLLHRDDLNLTRVTSHGNKRCEYTAEILVKNFSNPPSFLFFAHMSCDSHADDAILSKGSSINVNVRDNGHHATASRRRRSRFGIFAYNLYRARNSKRAIRLQDYFLQWANT